MQRPTSSTDGVAGQVNAAGIGIDFDLANGAAVRKNGRVHLVVFDDGKGAFPRVCRGAGGRLLGKFEEVEGAIGRARAEAAVLEFDLVRRRSQNGGGDRLAFGDQVALRPSRSRSRRDASIVPNASRRLP